MLVHNSMRFPAPRAVLSALLILLSSFCHAQVEFTPWGNIAGIRKDGQLTKFGTAVALVQNNWQNVQVTAKEVQRPKYRRNGTRQEVETMLGPVAIQVTAEDRTSGDVALNVSAKAEEAVPTTGVYVTFRMDDFSGGEIQLPNAGSFIYKNDLAGLRKLLEHPVSAITFRKNRTTVGLRFKSLQKVIVPPQPESGGTKPLYLAVPVAEGELANGSQSSVEIILTASSEPDKRTAQLTVDASKEGRRFDGFGGNFRLQNPRTDPLVIDYCLDNMRVAWGRVEMPWAFWHPDRNVNPRDSAANSKMHPKVKDAMAMARRLHDEGMPVILSAWSAPQWAIIGEPRFDVGPDGLRGNALREDVMNEIYRSIADYIHVLKDQYGVEITMFSFNESDLGINIRQTGEEHAALIKGLGKYFKEQGLRTTLLLGDNSDANTYSFIYPAMNDAETHPYIGAVSFHSWRGWEKETLEKWDSAATKLKKPLIVGEGSIDAQAWGYPNVFEEPSYALEEINLYIRLLDICEPASILQWQLTADYSPMAGAGIFGKEGPLRPTQRFFNLQQLASTPREVNALKTSNNHPDISFAALGNARSGKYAFHLVNKGSERNIVISGIPSSLNQLRLLVTDKDRGMKELTSVKVKGGKTSLLLPAGAFVSLMN